MAGLSRHRCPHRTVGWPRHGLDRRRPTDPVLLRHVSRVHRSLGPHGDSGVPACATCSGYSPAVESKLARLPHVAGVEASVETYAQILNADGTPPKINETTFNEVTPIASTDGLYFHQDRVTPVAGRMADPDRVDEMVMSAAAARLQGLHLGETVPVGFYTNAESIEPGFGTPSVTPKTRVRMKLVGLVVFHDALIQDQVDQYPTDELFTPALARKIGASGAGVGLYGLRLHGGAAAVSAVEAEIFKDFPTGSYVEFHVTATSASQADRAIRPEAIALAAFGAIVALAALLIAGQAIGRQLRLGGDEEATIRSLGASPTMTIVDSLLGIVMAIVAGSVLAVLVAVALSPLAPIGPVHAVYPVSRGVLRRGGPRHRFCRVDPPSRSRRPRPGHPDRTPPCPRRAAHVRAIGRLGSRPWRPPPASP